MQREALTGLFLVAAVAGCLGAQPADSEEPSARLPRVSDLASPQALAVRDGRDLVLEWSGRLGPGAFVPLVGIAPQSSLAELSLPVDGTVRTATLDLTGSASAAAALHDADGHVLCALRSGRTCASLVHATAATNWPLRVWSLAPEGVDFTLRVRLGADEPMLQTAAYAATGAQVHVTAEEGGEPTVAILDEGRLLVASGAGVLRFNPDGTYSDVTPPVDDVLRQTLDPFLASDRITGRVYVSQLASCMRLSWTDDGGDTWLTNPVACGGPEQHHQKIAVGPSPVAGRAVHLATMNLASWLATDDVAIVHSLSLDGGVTYLQTPALVKERDGIEARAVGNIEAAEEGPVYLVAYLCDRFVDAALEGVGIGRSDDYGLTWSWQSIASGGGRCEGIDPGLAVSRQGVFAAWEDLSAGTGQVWFAHSDNGRTWSHPEAIPTPGLHSFAFTDLAVSSGTAAVFFLATADTDLGPTQAPGWARWHPYLALYRFLRPELGWEVTRLQDDPVQIGPICMDGPMCLDGARNLLDFIDVQLNGAGDVAMAYADGCDADCTMPWQSRRSDLRVAWLPDGAPAIG